MDELKFSGPRVPGRLGSSWWQPASVLPHTLIKPFTSTLKCCRFLFLRGSVLFS